MGLLTDKVALISGAARGQGRSHAIRLAEEGARIVGFDICQQLDSVAYPMATSDDLAETVKLVEGAGGTMLAVEADVRDRDAISRLVADAKSDFGRIDIVLANAGIMPIVGPNRQDYSTWTDAIDVMLTGVYNTIEAALPVIKSGGAGGSIVITSSVAGLKGLIREPDTVSPGFAGYIAAKHGVVGLMRMYSNALAVHNIRVNTVHPTGVATPMVMNEEFPALMADHPLLAQDIQNLLDVPMVDPVDISNAILWLCCDTGRFVTGVTLPVDAGMAVR